MAKESGTKQERISITYFDGVNSTVQQTLAKQSELSHSENARSPMIGVLEKREGQVVIGTNASGGTFRATGNYGLVYFEDGGSDSQGLIRVSSVDGLTANIYYLDQDDVWTPVDNDYALGLDLAKCDFANVDGNLVIVNGVNPNRMITGDIGALTPMVTAATPGSMYNSPRANKVAFYKSRMYLADYYDSSNNEYKTTILRSSYPLGIISLVDGDVSAVDSSNNWVLPMTDTKYFYTASGMGAYEVYRGSRKIASISISSVNEADIVASNNNVTFESGFSSFLSADEVWVAGTFTGEKQYRWIANGSTVGRDVKQYDTFKLVGGDESAVTLLEPVGNILLIANRRTMMTWNDYTLENFDIGVGCCSKTGYAKLKGALYVMDYSGLYSTSGGSPKLMSRKVERYFKGATKAGLEAGAVGTKGLSVFCTIGDSTLYNEDGSVMKTLSDVCLEYVTVDDIWYVHTNVTATKFQTYLATSGAEKLTMASTTPARSAVVGPEMVTNGSFVGSADNWTLGTGWTYADNEVTHSA